MAAKKSSGGAKKALSTGRAGAQKATRANRTIDVEDYEHAEAKRTNNPPAGLAHLDREETPTKTLTYDPHLDPQLQWAGKAERAAADVPAPSIHVHEELSAEKVIGSVRRQRTQQALFDVGELDPAKAVEFYRHEMNWSNRMILGDSLVVMSSLLERERMAGKVQAVYIDPPYGIKFQSNFQPRVSDTEVRDRRDEDLNREPEMIQAYRDTWELGIHSYLTYLRDRLNVTRELLSDSGSVFVQINDENVHLVRTLLDEVFGAGCFVSQISYVTTSGFAQSKGLGRAGDYILWYAKNIDDLKVRPLWWQNNERSGYRFLQLADGRRRAMTASELDGSNPIPAGARIFRLDNATSQGASSSPQPFEFEGRTFLPGRNAHWKASYPKGMERLRDAGRLAVAGNTLSYVRFADDFGYQSFTNLWTDTVIAGFASDKRYVVQTSTKVVERCLLLATDPGDLVIDPTCGSGTTAYVCEHWGRRWITIDTSRVALTIARERLLTSTYPYFQTLAGSSDVGKGFRYQLIRRTTLGSIANEEQPDDVALFDRPERDEGKVRVSGPFTVEALSRYAVNPVDDAPAEGPRVVDASQHVDVLLNALRVQGVPRPRSKPAKIESLTPLSTVGVLQAEGVMSGDGKKVKFAVSLGPRFGAITMAQVSDALRDAVGFGMVVFAGFAVSPDAQSQLGTGKVGGVDVALLLANPDLLAGDLLKNTSASQTFRLYASPDVREEPSPEGWRVTVEGVDSFDAATGEVISFGRQGIQAWFLDDAYDGKVFRVSQAFFPVSNGWVKLSKALRGTVDSDLVEELHSWTSLPFETPESGRIAVRVIANDGNAAEVIKVLDPKGRKSS